MQEKLHAHRKDIDRVIQLTKPIQAEIGRGAGGRELSISYTKLQEAKMWIGKVLEELGSELPAEFRDKHND